jgi:NAD(P)-dependent dehydrogenase (short-subunit alcohol dehydrogenase family)
MSAAELLAQQTAIITGGAQGLGFAVARSMAQHGARVALLDMQADKAQEAAGSLPGAGHIGLYCDVTSQEARSQAVTHVLQTFGRIDVLVNNAGIQYHAAAEDMPEDRWRQVFDVNVHAMMFMSREVAPTMFAQGAGVILNIGSISSLLGMPRRSVYVTTKTAVLGLTRALAVEFAQRGIRVNAIGPGYHRTALFEEYEQRGVLDAERIRRRIPMGRLGTPEDIGRAAVFFASPLAEYVTGQFLMVDGGYTAFGAPEDASL